MLSCPQCNQGTKKVKLITDDNGGVFSAGCNLLSSASKACCGMVAEVPELKFLGSFADLSAEYHLATEFGEVGLQSMQDLGASILKSEINTLKKGKSVERKIVFQAEKYKNYKPKKVDTRCLLDKNLEIAENAKNNAARIRKLSDGRVRYYESEKAARTNGLTRGSAYVTEYDANKGVVRGWYESYDHAGNVNRVRPKMFNGKKVESLHYPHTGKELAEIAAKYKG